MVTKWYSFLKKYKEGCTLFSTRVWVGVFVMASIAPIFSALYVFFLVQEERLLNEKMGFLERKVKSFVEMKHQKEGFIQEFGLSDPLFLQTYIEPMPLLKEETELLSKIVKQTSYEPVQKRLSFLKGGGNQMQFVQKASKASLEYLETEWSLLHPVEVSAKDVRQILSLIEGEKKHPSRPQMIMKKFSLIANDGGFNLDFEILQRNCHAKN